jgi:DNA-binding transcriptional MerR regulator/predicted HicB family RNase H-like nuclease
MKNYYTLQEAADLLDCSTTTIYSYERRKMCSRIEDRHRLHGHVRFVKEEIDRLKEEKDQLDAKGKSVTDIAAALGVYPSKVKEAIDALNLKIVSVPTSIRSVSRRFAIASEQEEQIVAYIKQQKTPRPKRNHLYQQGADLALYQSFLVAEEDTLRLKQNGTGTLGFTLENDEFIPYVDALRTMDIEPRYPIHQPKQGGQAGFTDITVPTGRKAFYQILDALYAICGVENFNAEIRAGQLSLSVRNGIYPVSDSVSAGSFSLIKRHIRSGKMAKEDGYWVFSRSSKMVQLQFEEEVFTEMEAAAKKAGVSVKEWIYNLLEEKRQEREDM